MPLSMASWLICWPRVGWSPIGDSSKLIVSLMLETQFIVSIDTNATINNIIALSLLTPLETLILLESLRLQELLSIKTH